MAEQKQNERMEALVSLCKRRGFIFPASEIYGGINGFWDYGPMGAELKRNIKNAWWHDIVHNPPIGPDGQEISMVGLDSALIQNPRVWAASGHLEGFTDPMMDCRECKARFRQDQIYKVDLHRSEGLDDAPFAACSVEANAPEDAIVEVEGKAKKLSKKHGGGDWHGNATCFDKLSPEAIAGASCPACDAEGSLTEPRSFNMMFKTFVGASEDSAAVAYLRPETAQGIFVNYKNVLDTSRVKVPFGIAQIGKSFRNEINPRNYTFRSREFEQMEIEFFCHPNESIKWYEFWREQRINWYKDLGLASDHLRPREQGSEELAHYSKACTDIEYLFPFSDEPQELEGVAHRGNYDLGRHQEFSGKSMEYLDDQTKERFIPHVVEPSAGVDRFTLAVLCEASQEDEAPDEKGNMQKRTVMRFHPRLAPIKVAVFPLVRKDGMPEIATDLYRRLRKRWVTDYDEKSAVGRRYRRHDEIGTPFCVTVDGQTKEDNTVTVRDRDSMEQVRVSLDEIEVWLGERLGTA